MHRRTVLALAAATPLAGCSGLLGGDDTVSDGNPMDFDGNAGDELEITVQVEEVDELDDDMDVEREGVTFRLDHVEEGVIDTWTIEDDEETITVEVETDGTHRAMIIGGEAHVNVE